jgi:hypothetical protein
MALGLREKKVLLCGWNALHASPWRALHCEGESGERGTYDANLRQY